MQITHYRRYFSAMVFSVAIVCLLCNPKGVMSQTGREAPYANADLPALDENAKFTSFSVKHVEAYEVAGHLVKMLGNDPKRMRITVVYANNSLVVAGAEELLSRVEELIEVIDKPDERTPEQRSVQRRQVFFDEARMVPFAEPISFAESTGLFGELHAELNRVEVEIEKQSILLRKTMQEGEASDSVMESSRRELEKLVKRAFSLRQSVQRQQLKELNKRARLIENRLSEREDLQKQIVKRRLEGLLSSSRKSPSSVRQ